MLGKPFLPLLLLPALLGSCAGASSRQVVEQPDLSVEHSDPALSRVYVVRESEVYGKLLALRVYDNTTLIGSLGPGDFLCWERPSGRTMLTTTFERRGIDGGDVESYLDLFCDVGGTRYVAVKVNPSGAKPDPRVIEPTAGRELVAKSRPAPVK